MGAIVETSLENTIYRKNHMKEFGGLSLKAMKNLCRLLKQDSDICDLDFTMCGFLERLFWFQFAGLKARRSVMKLLP